MKEGKRGEEVKRQRKKKGRRTVIGGKQVTKIARKVERNGMDDLISNEGGGRGTKGDAPLVMCS